TWGPFVFVCGTACKNVGWQFDPELAVAADGTVYAAWLNTFDPGTVLSKSYDHGRTWTTPVTMSGTLRYNDKPILVISPSGKITRIGLSLYLRVPLIVTGVVQVRPWSYDFDSTVPGSNVFSHAAYTVPSAATASSGSNCQPTFLQAVPHTNTNGPHV